MILCTEILILLFYYNIKIQKALSTQEPNLWGGGNGGFSSFCMTTLFFFPTSQLPVKYFNVFATITHIPTVCVYKCLSTD